MSRERDHVAAFGHLAALALLWRWAPGWPSLLAFLVILAPLPAKTSRARLWLAALHVLVGIVGTAGDVLAVGAAGAGGAGLLVALSRGLVLAGAVLTRRAGKGGLFVATPVGVAVLCAGTLATTTVLLDLLCALLAVGAAVASAATAHDEDTAFAATRRTGARRPVFALAVVHAGLTLAFFLLAFALRDGAPSPLVAATVAGRPRPAIGLTSRVVFEGGGAPLAAEPTVVGTIRVDSARGHERGLLIRATALEKLDDDGFRPPGETGEGETAFRVREIDRLDSPSPLRLVVNLAEAPDGFLLTQGAPTRLEGARAVRDEAGNLVLGRGLRAPLAYALEAVESLDDDALLRTRVASPGLTDLPASLRDDADLRALAERLTRGITSAHGRARALEQRLSGEFDYDLSRRTDRVASRGRSGDSSSRRSAARAPSSRPPWSCSSGS